MRRRMRMRNMKKDQEGVVTAVRAVGELGRRIRDMGLVPGTEIRMQGRAPLYDPIVLRIKGFTLALRSREADYIEVEID